MIMAWICPKCGRPFKYETSYHSCVKVDVSTFTANKPAKIIKAFNKVLDKVRQWEDVMVAPAKTAVYLKAPSNFLSIKVTRNRIDLEFYLPEPTDEFPIYKVLQLTKTRILHCVALEDEKEVNAQLMNWIKQSYELLREKGTRKVRKSGGK
jgi:uncharacterized C2H2 Zn-finger protein